MTNELHEYAVWTGTGSFFPNLEVRELGGTLFRVSATRTPASPHLDYSNLIEANSLEEAIGHLQDYDYSYYDEATLHADEG